jgi:hypothetical protein
MPTPSNHLTPEQTLRQGQIRDVTYAALGTFLAGAGLRGLAALVATPRRSPRGDEDEPQRRPADSVGIPVKRADFASGATTMAAGVLSGLLGFKLTDKFVEAQEQQELRELAADAKKRLRRVIASTPLAETKTAEDRAANVIIAYLDQEYERVKKANGLGTAYGSYAGGMAALAAWLTYSRARAKSEANAAAAAEQEARRLRATTEPIYVTPE